MLPVSPPSPHASSSDGAGGGDIGASKMDVEEEVDLKEALFSDPIVGVERVISSEHGPGAISAQPLVTPRPMTPAEKAKHDLTHLPFHPGCPICASTRRPNSIHPHTHEHLRVVPLLVADYCFMKVADEKSLQPVLIMRLYPYKLFFAMAIPMKGVHMSVIRCIVNFLRDAGVTHFVYKSDREAAIASMIDEAVSMLGRFARRVYSDQDATDHGLPIAAIDDDEPDAPTIVPVSEAPQGPVVAVPELTHPGESASNGLAERSVRTIEDFTRTTLAALQAHVKIPITMSHPLAHWALQHAAYLMNTYQLGRDGHTAYGRLHGRETHERLCELGEKILWFVPKKLRSKADQPWRYGVFLGRALGSDQNFIGLRVVMLYAPEPS